MIITIVAVKYRPHMIITKRDFILRGSYFCEKYNRAENEHEGS